MDCKEPYRATKLWNEVIMAFQSGMPLKKHRRKMHTYRDCFMASDAVTWLHCYLMNNPNFGRDVTRQQATNLLGKFFKCRVMECISLKSKCDFSDNSHLYRFIPVSPQQFKTLPLRLVQSPSLRSKTNFKVNTVKSAKVNEKRMPEYQKENIPECLVVEKKMSLKELELTWKTATLARLESQLPGINLSNILDEKSVSGHVIKHNVCRISKTGVVSLIDKTDDIPHWVISAMKCLANWPNASGSGSCLPNYPGFEKDVFKVVRDFFINSQVPLLPSFLSSAMLNVFNHLLQEELKEIYNFESLFTTEDYNVEGSHVASSVEVATSTPVLDSEKKGPFSKNISLPVNNDGKLLLDDPEMMWDYPSMVYYETDFAMSDPVTKLVPDQSTLHANYGCLNGSIESISTISICSMNNETHNLNNYSSVQSNPLKNWSSDSCLQQEKKTGIAFYSFQLQRNMSVEHCNKQNHSMVDYLYVPDSGSDGKLNDSVCSSRTITEEDKITSYHSEMKQSNISSHSNQDIHCAILKNKSSPLSYFPQVPESCKKKNLKQFEDINFPFELKSSFQLLLLFLNPPNRRQLHLLFRVINKILKNKKFILDVKMPMRDYLLQTFLPAIVQLDINQNILRAMVSFLLDNCESLFQPPVDLKEEIEELCKFRNGRIIYSVDDACNLTYCEMVSKQQYEEQKISVSTEALKSLLNSIIMDEKLSGKERKRRIKQFKESHPDVYHELFPESKDLVKSKSTFLNRFASLRM